MWLFLATVLAASPQLPETKRAIAFYNARLSLREGKSHDVLKLWLLRNALAHHKEPAAFDDDFRSVAWAAIGNLGICPDGFLRDVAGGAGLWSVAYHNWVLTRFKRGEPSETDNPWNAFEVPRQQRLVSLYDVLNEEEWKSVKFFRTNCLAVELFSFSNGGVTGVDFEDRLSVAKALRRLLQQSLKEFYQEKTHSLAAIEARIFDLNLVIAQLEAQKVRRELREKTSVAREAGVSKEGIKDMKEREVVFAPDSESGRFLLNTLSWNAEDWLSLSPERRQFLFSLARKMPDSKQQSEKVALAIVNELISLKKGAEVAEWLGFLASDQEPRLRREVFLGDRGKRLLELDDGSGFRERAIIALHRGVTFLEQGAREEALRAFAYALKHAADSRASNEASALSRRWLSYVLSRYETNAELLATLKALVPKQDYNAVMEDLLWRAALRADGNSFNLISESSYRGTSLERKIRQLQSLAQGKTGVWLTALRDGMLEEPYFTLRTLKTWLEEVESEEVAVRRLNSQALRGVIREVLSPAADAGKKPSSHSRTAEALLLRAQSILDGLLQLDQSMEGKARGMAVSREVFAGSLRLPPADALPWPFTLPSPQAPSVFVPIKLTPEEWLAEDEQLVFGWRVSE